MAQNARQRARMQARLARRSADLRAADVEANDEPELKGAGAIEGSAFDWESSLYVDPETRALWDGGDLEARDIREALASDWKMRQLSMLLTSSIVGASWKLVPGKGDTGEAADTEEKLRRPANAGGMTTPIGRVVAQAASARVYRRAFFAKSFKLDAKAADGSVMFRQLAMRPASTCHVRVDPIDGSFDGFVQEIVWFPDGKSRGKDEGKPAVFPPKKALVFTNGLDRDPVRGVSDLEVAMWCYRTKRKVMLLWLTFLSAQALPRTIVKYTGGDEAKAIAAAKMIANLSGGGVGYIDGTNLTAEVLESRAASAPFLEMVRYLDSCQGGSVLAGFTDLTSAASEGRGSFALHDSATEVFDQATEHAAGEFEDVLTNYAVADLVRYNYGPDGVVPAFKFDPLNGAAEGPLMTLLQALATAPSSSLPQEFVNELAQHAARLLGLDVDKIAKALETQAQRAKEQAAAQGATGPGQMAAAANGAVEGVRAIARQVAGAGPIRPRALPVGGTVAR